MSRPAARWTCWTSSSGSARPRRSRPATGRCNYWQTHLRDIPPRTFGGPVHADGRQGKRFWHARFGSPAAHLAVLAIARRTGMDTSRVLFGVIATALGRASEMPTLTAKVISSNRFRPGLAEVIAPVAQNSLVSVDLTGATVDEVDRARPAGVAGRRHARLLRPGPPRRGDGPAGRRARLPGAGQLPDQRPADDQPATGRRAGAHHRGDPAPDRGEAPETWFSWDGTLDHLHEQAFITVEDYGDTVHLQLIFDMSLLHRVQQIENFVHGMEQVAVEAAFDAEAPAGIG